MRKTAYLILLFSLPLWGSEPSKKENQSNTATGVANIPTRIVMKGLYWVTPPIIWSLITYKGNDGTAESVQEAVEHLIPSIPLRYEYTTTTVIENKNNEK